MCADTEASNVGARTSVYICASHEFTESRHCPDVVTFESSIDTGDTGYGAISGLYDYSV